jgi:hypothetical protein
MYGQQKKTVLRSGIASEVAMWFEGSWYVDKALQLFKQGTDIQSDLARRYA